MRQFDVLDNPVPRARRAMPFVAILQSDLAETGRDRIVAPFSAQDGFAWAVRPAGADRHTIGDHAYALLIPALTAVPAAELKAVHANLAEYRDRIIAALDYLFLGI